MTIDKIRTFADLEALDGHVEDRTLEIKSPEIRTDRLVKVIQAGANGVAAKLHIVIGAKEGDGRFRLANLQPVTWPLKLKGVTFDSFDKYKQNIVAVARATTSGFVEPFFDIREIEVPGGSVIVVEVPQSSRRPHQNTSHGHFPIKGDGRRAAMNIDEIRELLCKQPVPVPSDDDIGDIASPWIMARDMQPMTERDLRPGALISRVDEQTGDDRHVRISGQAYLTLTLEPDTMGKTWDTADLVDKVESCPSFFFPLNCSGRNRIYSRSDHGAVVWAQNDVDPSLTTSATQVDRYGKISAIDTLLLDPATCTIEAGTKEYKVVFARKIEDVFNEALWGFAQFLSHVLEFRFPLRGGVGIVNVEGYRLEGDRTARTDQHSIFESISVHDGTIRPETMLLPFYRKLWRGFRRERT